MRTALVAAALLVLGTGVASAQANLAQATAGFLYFNRPGASIAEHDSELKNCAEVASNNYIAASLTSDRQPTFSLGQGVLGDAIGSVVNRSMLSGWARAHWNIVLEHCMVVRGWRLMRLDTTTGERLEALAQGALHREFEQMVGVQDSRGEVARIWRNEGGAPGTVMAISPRNAQRVMLSALAVPVDAPSPAEPVEIDPGRQYGDVQLQPVNAASLPTIPDGQALLIVGLIGARDGSRHYGIELRHSDGGRTETARIHYGGAERVDGRLQNTLAFVVSVGEWAVAGDAMHMNYCMGAPAFTVGSAEVVFVGEFDRSVQLNPDLSEAAKQRHVPPSLRQRTRSAQWENGARWACPATNVYSLEFEGFPFRSNYQWGSRALQN